MINQLRISTKIRLFITTILCVIFFSGLYIYKMFTPVTQSWNLYQDQVASRQVMLMDIKAQFGYGGMIHNFKNYVLRGDDKYTSRIEKNYQALLNDINKYQQLSSLATEERQALTAIKTVAKNYFDNSRVVQRMFTEGSTAEYIDSQVKISDSPALKGFEVLDKKYHELTRDYGVVINTTISDGQTATLIGLTTIAVLVIITLTLLYRSILDPLRTLRTTMQDIAQGKGDLSVRLNTNRKDEFGELATSFNTFVSSLDSLIKEQREIINNIKLSADSLSDITTKSDHSIQTQHMNTEQLVTAIDQLTATVHHVSTNSNTAKEMAITVSQKAHSGQHAVENTMYQIQNINTHLQEASGIVMDVNRASDNIGQVLNVISEIAEQTNLLALNAAIEAARAGESGRGFAVVADEVRGLAQRTGTSLDDIKKIILDLQSGVSNAVDAMSKGRSEVEEGNSVAQTANTNINEVVSSINGVEEMNIQISTASEQQNAVVEEMNSNVHKISEMTTAISDDSESIVLQSESLAHMTSKLTTLVAKFKVSA